MRKTSLGHACPTITPYQLLRQLLTPTFARTVSRFPRFPPNTTVRAVADASKIKTNRGRTLGNTDATLGVPGVHDYEPDVCGVHRHEHHLDWGCSRPGARRQEDSQELPPPAARVKQPMVSLGEVTRVIMVSAVLESTRQPSRRGAAA